MGKARVQELQGSCQALGIHPGRCIALDHPELQDNPKVWWNTDLIESIVREHVSKWKIDAVRPSLPSHEPASGLAHPS
jgi:N-acetylglucosaminylphosphatidylinositol deacetylase